MMLLSVISCTPATDRHVQSKTLSSQVTTFLVDMQICSCRGQKSGSRLWKQH